MDAIRTRSRLAAFSLRWLKRTGIVVSALALVYQVLPKPDLLPPDLEYSPYRSVSLLNGRIC